MITVNNFEIDTKSTFPDGTLLMKYQYNKKFCHPHINVEWTYENDGELFALICLTKQLPRVKEKHLIMKYLPHARQDRVKKPEDVFTLKYFCEIINSLGYDKVRVLDAHSNVSLALLNNVEPMDVSSHINQAIYLCKDTANFALYFPDEGAMKRYSDGCGLPYTFGIKKRNWEDGKILGVQIADPELVSGKDILIVDDICSRGGTFYHSAKALKEAGAANISLYITHCENTILEGEIFTSGLINNVYTTDSLVHCEELKEKIIYV
jgi:ribose-phosphate pyrophosphokinase